MLQSLRSRKPIPDEITNAPRVTDSNAVAWRCYWDLRRGANEAFALRWVDVLMWANAYGMSTFEMEALQTAVTILDSVFIPFIKEKRAAEAARAEAERKRLAAASRGTGR